MQGSKNLWNTRKDKSEERVWFKLRGRANSSLSGVTLISRCLISGRTSRDIARLKEYVVYVLVSIEMYVYI